MRVITHRLSAVILLILSVPMYAAMTQESDSYRIERLAITSMAAHSASPSFQSATTAVLVHGVSGVCPQGVSTALGFWSSFEPSAVPIVLRLGKDTTNPSRTELEWTGQASQFNLFRSALPQDVTVPGNLLLATGQCSASDQESGAIFYYRVVASDE